MRKINGIQLGTSELLLIAKTVEKYTNARFLVFGFGNDIQLRQNVNHRGLTIFIEDNHFWIDRVSSRVIDLNVIKIKYKTRLKEWKLLLDTPEKLEMSLPEHITSEKFDVILVDAPAGYDNSTPGPMQSIYTASKLIKKGGDVFVHDCNREVEDIYSLKFIKKENLKQEIGASIGILRHFCIEN